MPLISVIQRAWQLKPYQISGPAWLSEERYEIQGMIPQGTNAARFEEMLRNLLTERFQLAVHRAAKEMKGFELVVVDTGLNCANRNLPNKIR